MALNKVTFQTSDIQITIQRFHEEWYFQVLRGSGSTIHVESKDFRTYREAVDYAFEKYGLITE